MKEKYGFSILKDRHGKDVYARTENQLKLTKLIDENQIVLCDGPAGSGKTYLAVAKAVQLLKSDRGYEKIILTRPIVEAGESLGFLPGELGEKVSPYMAPLYDYINEFVENKRSKTQGQYPSKYKDKKKKQEEAVPEMVVNLNEFIQVVPLAFMRGRTFNNAIVILDEAQNTSEKQILLLLTRLGHNCKIIITGDQTQKDIKQYGGKSAFLEAMERLHGVRTIGVIQFNKGDIVRNDLIQDILDAYNMD